jgi:hypothetical protein
MADMIKPGWLKFESERQTFGAERRMAARSFNMCSEKEKTNGKKSRYMA